MKRIGKITGIAVCALMSVIAATGQPTNVLTLHQTTPKYIVVSNHFPHRLAVTFEWSTNGTHWHHGAGPYPVAGRNRMLLQWETFRRYEWRRAAGTRMDPLKGGQP